MIVLDGNFNPALQLLPLAVPERRTVVAPLLVVSPADRVRSAEDSPQHGSLGGGPLVTMEVTVEEIISTSGADGGVVDAADAASPPPPVNFATYKKSTHPPHFL